MRGSAFEALLENGLVWQAQGGVETARNTEEPLVRFGVDQIDRELSNGGLPFSTIHEWVSTGLETRPITIVSLLVRNAFREVWKQEKSWNRFFLWIGKECWPTPFLLAQLFPPETHSLVLQNSLFLHPQNQQDRLWTVDCALRSAASFSVAAFMPELTLAQSKRFTLALQKHPERPRLALFFRPEARYTAAHSKWQATPIASPTNSPRWRIELSHQKGKQARVRCWEVELANEQVWENETLSLRLPAEVVTRSHPVERKAS